MWLSLRAITMRAPTSEGYLDVKMKRFTHPLRLLAACGLALLAWGCASPVHPTMLGAVPTFTVSAEPAGPPLVGFGAQLNPYLYCKPNWGAVNDSNVQTLESEVIALHPQHVRIFCLLDWFTPAGDPQIAKGDPRVRESFIRTVRLAQQAGATVNLTLWYNFWKTPEKSAADFADVLRELIEDEHLTAIQYLTLGNEVNSSDDKISIDIYNRTYLALDRELKRAGIRDRIKIVSGDLVYLNQEIWFDDLAMNLSKASDGYSVHIYWDYWDTAKILRRISEVQKIASTQPASEQRPLFVTEFGTRGHQMPKEREPGRFSDGTPLGDTSVPGIQCAWLMLEALNRGYVATVEWECFDAWYDQYMHYGLLGGVQTGWKIRPAYHMLQLFTHTTQPGWQAMQVSGSADNISIAATHGSQWVKPQCIC